MIIKAGTSLRGLLVQETVLTFTVAFFDIANHLLGGRLGVGSLEPGAVFFKSVCVVQISSIADSLKGVKIAQANEFLFADQFDAFKVLRVGHSQVFDGLFEV